MKKSLVKILTVALAAATLAGMSAMALPVSALSSEDTGVITVKNVKDLGKTVDGSVVAPTVTAYQVVKGTYAGGAWTGYELTDIATEAGVASVDELKSDAITVATVEKLGEAAVTLGTSGTVMTRQADTSYTANVEAGLYIVVVTGADTVVYNPALVAVNVGADNTLSGSAVAMDSTFTDVGNVAYMKSEKPTFNKDIVVKTTNDGEVEETKAEGDTVAFGDTVSFQLDSMKIPTYSDAYVKKAGTAGLVYKIEDSLDPTAFKGIDNLTVYVGGTADSNKVTADTATYTVKYTGGTGADDATGFEVAFTDEFIRANLGKSVQINYDSEFTSSAYLNYAENKNTAKLSYSNNPTNLEDVAELTDTTYHYTFGIDADIDTQAPNPDDNTETYELNKVTEAKTAETPYVEGDSKKSAGVKTSLSQHPLEGAEFKLYTDAACETVLKIAGEDAVATSDENGHIKFTGLDEGVYYMKETKAPDTYTKNNNIYRITISAQLNAVTGVMESYTIKTELKTGENSYTNAGKATYNNDPVINNDGTVTNKISVAEMEPAEIVNTKLAELPATGGVGTVALTVGAGIGMAGFMTLYITNKKKKNSENE